MKLFLLILILFSHCAFSDLYVVAHKSFNQDDISLIQLRSLYSGDSQYINELRIIPLDQNIHSENYETFYHEVVNESMPKIISHWSKLIFTGKGQAPISLAGDMSIIDFVSKNPNSIGYTRTKPTTDSVKVVQVVKVSQYKDMDIESLKNR